MAHYSAIDPQNPVHPETYAGPGYEKSRGGSGRKWLVIGVPVAILVIAGAVVGGILGSRAANKNSSGGGSSGAASEAAASSAASVKASIGVFATATNSQFMVPIYPTATNQAYAAATRVASVQSWGKDPFQPQNPSPTGARPDRPRLIAPAYKWAALPSLIASDPYLAAWNDTIFHNATVFDALDPVKYNMDGPSGMLDNAREIKQRIKAFAYVYRMTGNNTKWLDRTWRELQNAVGKGNQPFGFSQQDPWNSAHFLDLAELSSAFAIAYDWLHDSWSENQLSEIRTNIIQYGLDYGILAYEQGTNGWWTNKINGNWNCVCNSGLTMAALALLGDDTSGKPEKILGFTVPNFKTACSLGPSTDGTWAETANYWYFGTTGHAEMVSSLLTATGSSHDLIETNKDSFAQTGDYHIYAYGPTSLFDWGDHGPNKFSTTANSMIFYANKEVFDAPRYALFQRDRPDAAEPWSVFWYDPTLTGAWWTDLALDRFFEDPNDSWAAMRSSFPSFENSLYIGIKAGQNDNHQTHNDLDVGDFVLDALGTRWAGELGSADYRQETYFLSSAQDSDRWKWYRKATVGQNTIVVNGKNQLVSAKPTIQSKGSSGAKQASDPSGKFEGTAWWVTDMSSAYDSADVSSIKRGARLVNSRRQVLLQDEITLASSTATVQWRMHTNASIALDGSTATLERDGKTLKATILSPAGATFGKEDAKRADNSPIPAPPSPDQENPQISVLVVNLTGGSPVNLQVLFSPQWTDAGYTALETVKSVDLSGWNEKSHD